MESVVAALGASQPEALVRLLDSADGGNAVGPSNAQMAALFDAVGLVAGKKGGAYKRRKTDARGFVAMLDGSVVPSDHHTHRPSRPLRDTASVAPIHKPRPDVLAKDAASWFFSSESILARWPPLALQYAAAPPQLVARPVVKYPMNGGGGGGGNSVM